MKQHFYVCNIVQKQYTLMLKKKDRKEKILKCNYIMSTFISPITIVMKMLIKPRAASAKLVVCLPLAFS